MGGERTRKRKHVLRCIACMICLLISGCAFLERIETQLRPAQEEPWPHLVRAQKLLTQGEYEASLRENQAALSRSANKPPGDEALFNMGLIYIDPLNPRKDYSKSREAFMRVITEYPEGRWTEQAKVWVQVIQETESAKRASAAAIKENEKLKRASAAAIKENEKLNEKLKGASTTANQENEKLRRSLAEAAQENERLRKVIEQSTKVDIEIEEKKKEKAR